MIILSNCLSDSPDEGALKLASSIVKRLKNEFSDTYVVTYERECSLSDAHFSLNKFLLSKKLISVISKSKHCVLYIPFPAKTLYMSLRAFILSLFSRNGLKIAMIRHYPMNWLAKLLLKLSKAEIIVFSKEAYRFYRRIVGERVQYIKCGIDINKFLPVSQERTKELKRKYGFDSDIPLILHVGHMKEGRNISQLMKIDKRFQVLLVISTLSKERQSSELRAELSSCNNIKVFDDYIANIEEIYQMSDVYFFPVKAIGHCIDVPLSCLEAAACNKPVITTDFGEMKEFVGKEGFFFIENFDESEINSIINEAINSGDVNTRNQVLDYDWSYATKRFFGS